MTLSQQVISLDLAKRLRELNVKQESLFYWIEVGVEKDGCLLREFQVWGYREGLILTKDSCSAFTVAELGEILSNHFSEWAQGWNDSGCFWHFRFGGRGSGNMIDACGKGFSALELDEDTEANARASLIIHLIEEKIITV